MTAFYNEIDPYAAQWLKNLIAAGHIAPGIVDTRSIFEIEPYDLREFTQCHFFAGIGVWSHALRRAGWPDEREVWTGSCPCQPFSVAGRAGGFADERHLWPHWHHLIRERRPPVVFGEQVASKDGLDWLDLVQADLEGEGYAATAVDICAAGVGAPHIRQRLYFVADAAYQQHNGAGIGRASGRNEYSDSGTVSPLADNNNNLRLKPAAIAEFCPNAKHDVESHRDPRRLGDDDDARLEGQRSGHQAESGRHGTVRPVAEAGEFGGLEHALHIGRQRGQEAAPGYLDDRSASERPEGEHGAGVTGAHRIHQDRAGPTNGHWRDADWLFCRDGKWRPVEPGTFPLVDGLPRGVVPSSRVGVAFDANKTAEARVMRLRGYGNAINPIQAALFVESFMDSMK